MFECGLKGFKAFIQQPEKENPKSIIIHPSGVPWSSIFAVKVNIMFVN